jgi:hypothetical protein
VRRWALALLLLTALCGGARAAQPPRGSAYVLLQNGTVVRIALPQARVVVSRRVGPAAHGPDIEAGRFLARRGGALYVLDPASKPTLTALEPRALAILWQRSLDADVHYRGVVLAGRRLLAYGYRPGRAVGSGGLTEGAAVLTAVGLDGTSGGSWTVRPAERHWWWEWWGAAAADGRSLALTWHGGCNADSGTLCTTGADLVDVSAAEPRACPRDAGADGCVHQVHGAIEPYRGGWIATTGGETLLVLDRGGRVVQRLHSRLRDHVMSFVLDAPHGRLFVLGTCYLGVEGLREVSLTTGSSRLVARHVCGSDPVLGPEGTILAVAARTVSPGYDLIVLSRSSGRVLRHRRLPGVLALLGAT